MFDKYPTVANDLQIGTPTSVYTNLFSNVLPEKAVPAKSKLLPWRNRKQIILGIWRIPRALSRGAQIKLNGNYEPLGTRVSLRLVSPVPMQPLSF